MHNYFPALLGKQAEFVALRHIEQKHKIRISPIIELLSEKQKGLSIGKITSEIGKHWRFAKSQFLFDFDKYEKLSVFDLRSMIGKLHPLGIACVPVISGQTTQKLQSEFKTMLGQKNLALAIRSTFATVESFESQHYNRFVEQVLSNFGIERSRVILLLDVGYIHKDSIQGVGDFLIDLINSISFIHEFRSLVLISGSFPSDLSAFEARPEPYFIPRYEQQLFSRFQYQGVLVRPVVYGDFGIRHPRSIPANHPGTCSIKYSMDEQFLIYRGHLSANDRLANSQFIVHASKLVRSRHYYGEDFSWADLQIQLKSKEPIGEGGRPGSLKTWLEIGQNHHFALIQKKMLF